MYAQKAAQLTSLLRLHRKEGRKGSKKKILWTPETVASFHAMKLALASALEVYQVQPDLPFWLTTDASTFAIGAVLEQKFNGTLKPVAFFSRKLTQGQLKRGVREAETYALVSSLWKWASIVGLQPIFVRTEHKPLTNWLTEKAETPCGRAGRRARWRETLSRFNLVEIEYIKGKENLVADCMSRYAFLASQAMRDVSKHGTIEDWEEVQEILKEEKITERERSFSAMLNQSMRNGW